MRLLTQISRYFIGLLFIVSGLIKANDPLGFSYKLNEYFEVFHTSWLVPVSLYLAVFLCVLEVVLGVALLLAYRMRVTSWLLLLLTLFFLLLTGYSAITGKVTDCGCFGDAVHRTASQAFVEDLVQLAFILIIFFNCRKISTAVSLKVLSSIVIASTLIVTIFSIYCYRHLPIIDFRPFAKGKNISAGMTVPEGAPRDEYKTVLYYEKNGKVKEFTTENYPWQDTTWKWKDTKSVLVKEGYHAPIHDFRLSDAEGNDRTQEVLNYPGYTVLIISYNVNTAAKKAMDKINELVADCGRANVKVLGLSGSSLQETDVFRHDVNAMFDFYNCDPTTLKTMIRSNPGVMLIKKGTVVNMWHYNDAPGFNELNNRYHFVAQ